MNLHLMCDEKVISRTIASFEKVLPNQNKYIILVPNVDYKCKHVHLTSSNVHYLVYDTPLFWNTIGDVKQYKNIIIHFLTDEDCYFINKINHPSITWIVWGADLYNDMLDKVGFKLYADEKLINDSLISSASERNKLSTLKTWVKNCMPLLTRLIRKSKHLKVLKQRLKAVEKINYVAISPGDFSLLLHYFPQYQHLKQKNFFYYPINEIIPKDFLSSASLGNNIIIGNSASFTNNHIYVMKKLAKVDYGSRKILMPLSYGGNDYYVNKVIETGKILLGDNYEPIIDFMSLQQYNKLLLSSSTYIYGNFRQEAFGNILTGLYVGATVFMEGTSPLLHDLKQKGFLLFSLDQLKDKINYHLTNEEIMHNREIALSEYSEEKLMRYIKESFA